MPEAQIRELVESADKSLKMQEIINRVDAKPTEIREGVRKLVDDGVLRSTLYWKYTTNDS